MQSERPIARWMAAIGCYGVAAFFVNRSGSADDSLVVLGCVLGAIVSLLAGTALLLPDLLRLIGRLVNALYFPGGKLDKPVLSYKLPEYYRRNERYEEALEQYDIILKHYPGEVRAWIGAIEVLMIDFGAREQAERYFERGYRKLRSDPEAREQLKECWRALSATAVAS